MVAFRGVQLRSCGHPVLIPRIKSTFGGLVEGRQGESTDNTGVLLVADPLNVVHPGILPGSEFSGSRGRKETVEDSETMSPPDSQG